MRNVWLLPCCALACSPTRFGTTDTGQPAAVFPARYADDSSGGSTSAGEAAESTSAVDGGAPERLVGDLPDPQPLRMAQQWEYVVHFQRGTVTVESVVARELETPQVTARRVGRFAIELWIGRELVDRVRFDFPLLAAEPPPTGDRRPLEQPPSLAAGADSLVRVLVPASPRATRAVLVDRATGEIQGLPWPPDHPIEPAAARRDGRSPTDAGPSQGPPGPRAD